jgi:hypothetical protein
MPKPILKPSEAQKTAGINLNAQPSLTKVHDPVLVEKVLRKKRSPEHDGWIYGEFVNVKE